jgi:hypothetical protein
MTGYIGKAAVVLGVPQPTVAPARFVTFENQSEQAQCHVSARDTPSISRTSTRTDSRYPLGPMSNEVLSYWTMAT